MFSEERIKHIVEKNLEEEKRKEKQKKKEEKEEKEEVLSSLTSLACFIPDKVVKKFSYLDKMIKVFNEGRTDDDKKRAKIYDLNQQSFEKNLQMLRNFDVMVDKKVIKGRVWIAYMNSEYPLAQTPEQRQQALKDAVALLYMDSFFIVGFRGVEL